MNNTYTSDNINNVTGQTFDRSLLIKEVCLNEEIEDEIFNALLNSVHPEKEKF